MSEFEHILRKRGAWNKDTHASPQRALKALYEMTEGYETDVEALFTTFPCASRAPVIVSGIEFVSVCEHHLMPFRGIATAAYQPQGRVLGLSKVARIVDVLAKRFQLQERLGDEIERAIQVATGTVQTAVILDASHSCMCCRGIRRDATTRTLHISAQCSPLLRDQALALHEKEVK